MRVNRCPIFLTPIRDLRCCDGCNTPLTGRQSRWCSDPCWQRYFRNHAWGEARNEAIHRTSVHEPLAEDLRQLGWRWGVVIWTICDSCGKDLNSARVLEDQAEVNHVDPRNGQGYEPGCWNHQTNLQVLCHTCHAIETARQARERAAARRAAGEQTLPLWGAA